MAVIRGPLFAVGVRWLVVRLVRLVVGVRWCPLVSVGVVRIVDIRGVVTRE